MNEQELKNIIVVYQQKLNELIAQKEAFEKTESYNKKQQLTKITFFQFIIIK